MPIVPNHQVLSHLSTTIPRASYPANLALRTFSSCHRSFIALLTTIAKLQESDSKLEHHGAKHVALHGHIRSVRKQKIVAFAALSDGTSLDPAQVVLRPDQAENLSTGAAVRITGTWQKSLPGKKQGYELHAESVEVAGDHDAGTFPLQKKYHTLEYLRTLPHLRVRLPYNALLLRLRSQIMAHLSLFFNDQGFVQAHTPIITSSDCEGGGEVFSVSSKQSPERSQEIPETHAHKKEHFFNAEKYLTVSSQLHLEALAQSVGKVWTLSPTFRAERSDTPRHLSEFYMLEAELSFTDSLEPIMELLEDMLHFVVDKLQRSQVGEDLLKAASYLDENNETIEQSNSEILLTRWNGMLRKKWPRITFHEAIRVLLDAQGEGRVQFSTTPALTDGLSVEHERFLASYIGNGQPIFVTEYPAHLKPFYVLSSSSAAAVNSGCDDIAQSFDLLVPEVCEMAGGSIREHRLDRIIDNMKSRRLFRDHKDICLGNDELSNKLSDKPGLSNESLDWYIDLRRYGSAPHGGFGLGFDRLLSYIAGVPNVRDVVAFPRWYGRCDC